LVTPWINYIDVKVEQDIQEYDTTRGNYRPWYGESINGRFKRSVWYPFFGVGGKDASSIFEASPFMN
jgi:hypothetical protein